MEREITKESKKRRATDITKEEEQNMAHILNLPSHIMSEIMVRLPIETIIHCARVCKAWRSLILDSTFAKLQLAREPARLLLIEHYKNLPLNSDFRMVALEDDIYFWPSLEFIFPTIIKAETVRLVATCNGLLCMENLVNKELLCICNPIRGEYVTLPKPTTKDVSYKVNYSFGSSLATNQCKVIRISKRQSKWDGEIYTLGTNAWRSIGDIEFPPHEFSSIVYLNGAFHWFAEGVHDLCCFDIANERLLSFPSPPLNGDKIAFQKLGVMGSCLFLTERNNSYFNSHFNIWVMKDYGVKESWSIELVIKNRIPCEVKNGLLSGFMLKLNGTVFTPIKVLKDGNVLMLYGDWILLTYNPRMGSCQRLEVPGRRDPYVAMVYVPSFLSPKDAGMGE